MDVGVGQRRRDDSVSEERPVFPSPWVSTRNPARFECI